MSVVTRFFSRVRGWLMRSPFYGEADAFLVEQRRAQPVLSASQLQERLKHHRIQQKRDRAEMPLYQERPYKLWGEF